MSTVYNGGKSASILSSTNASPIVITTTAAHGFTSSDVVIISGHLVNTAANGRWSITVLSGTTFSLTNSKGNGVGGATGTAYDDSFPTGATIPSDGDNMDAVSVNVALEALLDRTSYLSRRIQPLGLVELLSAADNSTHTENTSGGLTDFQPFSAAIGISSVECSANDVLKVSCDGFATSNTISPANLRIEYRVNGGSWGALNTSSYTQVVDTTGTNTVALPFALVGVLSTTLQTTPGIVDIRLAAGGLTTLQVKGFTLVIEHLRPQS